MQRKTAFQVCFSNPAPPLPGKFQQAFPGLYAGVVHERVKLPKSLEDLGEYSVGLRTTPGMALNGKSGQAHPPKLPRSLKGFTAHQANKLLQRTGEPFWQHESYDHRVRDGKELESIRAYIAGPACATPP